ncbi:MAG: branched-chain amino acid ABC transporter permease [Spirochaetales bacterium]|nr:branched-chain amino acid ABC transporter permease [Spirochaetales bacterium]
MIKYWKYILIAIILLLGVLFPFYAGAYQQSIARTVLIYLVLAISWDMLLRSGQLSFGMAGLFGIGSYASVLLLLRLGASPMLSILGAGLVAFVVAALLGILVLRLRAMYFAITTLAIGEIFRIIIRNWSSFTGGPEGAILPNIIFDGDPVLSYWLVLGLALLAIVLSVIFQKTRIYFALTAIRNNEVVAKSSGINIFKYLVIVFAITSALQGMAGGVFAQTYGFVTPESSFSADYILLPIAMALLGGIYGTLGPIIGTVLLGVLAEYLKLYIPYGHLIVYGIIIICIIMFMPQGIVGVVRSKIIRREVG